MKNLGLITFVLLASLKAQATRVETRNLNFQYVSNEGGLMMDCVHSQIRDLPDWEVVCGKGTPQQKRYTVHFLTKQVQRSNQPLTTLEYLYAVTEWEFVKPVYASTSFWLSLNEKSVTHSLRFYQGIENDVANLVLDYKP